MVRNPEGSSHLRDTRTTASSAENKSFRKAAAEPASEHLFRPSSNEVAELVANSDFKTQKNMLLFSLVHVASFNPIHGPDAIMKGLASPPQIAKRSAASVPIVARQFVGYGQGA